MSETPSSSRQCNNCNRLVAVITLNNLEFCCECNSLILPAGDYILYQDILHEFGDYFQDLLQRMIAEEEEESVRRGAPTAAKSSFEVLETFEVVVSSSSSEVCAVCIDAMVIGEICKKLPCGHCYHENCILPWLRKTNSCPICRFQLSKTNIYFEM